MRLVMGHGSWVMGHGSWVMGHGSWVMGNTIYFFFELWIICRETCRLRKSEFFQCLIAVVVSQPGKGDKRPTILRKPRRKIPSSSSDLDFRDIAGSGKQSKGSHWFLPGRAGWVSLEKLQ